MSNEKIDALKRHLKELNQLRDGNVFLFATVQNRVLAARYDGDQIAEETALAELEVVRESLADIEQEYRLVEAELEANIKAEIDVIHDLLTMRAHYN